MFSSKGVVASCLSSLSQSAHSLNHHATTFQITLACCNICLRMSLNNSQFQFAGTGRSFNRDQNWTISFLSKPSRSPFFSWHADNCFSARKNNVRASTLGFSLSFFTSVLPFSWLSELVLKGLSDVMQRLCWTRGQKKQTQRNRAGNCKHQTNNVCFLGLKPCAWRSQDCFSFTVPFNG